MGTQEKPLPQTEEEVFAQSEYNLKMRDFTLILGKAIVENAEFRKMLKMESEKMITGEGSAIVYAIADKPVDATNNAEMQLKSGGITVRNLLKETHKKIVQADCNSIFLKSSIGEFIDDFLAQNRYLQVSFLNEDKWDEKNMPLIAFVTEEEELSFHIPGYDSGRNFEFVALDVSVIPDKPLILIDQNERIDIFLNGLTPNTVVAWPVGFDPVPFYDLIAEMALDDGEGGWIPPVDTNPPSAPTNLTATQVNDGLKISWTIPPSVVGAGVRGYKIYKKQGSETNFNYNSPWKTLSGYYNNSYVDQSIVTGLTYCYQVKAYNDIGDSDPSNIACETGIARPLPPLTFFADLDTRVRTKVWWTTDPAQYIDKIELFSRKFGDWNFVKQFNSNEYDHFHIHGGAKGDRVDYKIHIKNGESISNPKYDFIKIPEREPKLGEPIIIRKVYTDYSVVKWIHSAPTFYIKVLNTKGTNYNVANEVQEQVIINFIGGIGHSWDKVQNFDAYVLHSWTMDLWYEMMTFYAIRINKQGGGCNFNINAKYEYKLNFNQENSTLANNNTANITVSFSKSPGTDPNGVIGKEYLSYYDPIFKVLCFPNHGVKVLVGNNGTIPDNVPNKFWR